MGASHVLVSCQQLSHCSGQDIRCHCSGEKLSAWRQINNEHWLKDNLSQCHFVLHKSHMLLPGTFRQTDIHSRVEQRPTVASPPLPHTLFLSDPFRYSFPPESRPPQGHSDFPTKCKQQHSLREHPNNVTCDSYRCAHVTHHRQGLSQDCPRKHEEAVLIATTRRSIQTRNWTARTSHRHWHCFRLRSRNIAGIYRNPGSTHWTGWVSPIPDLDAGKTRKITAPAENWTQIPQPSTRCQLVYWQLAGQYTANPRITRLIRSEKSSRNTKTRKVNNR